MTSDKAVVALLIRYAELLHPLGGMTGGFERIFLEQVGGKLRVAVHELLGNGLEIGKVGLQLRDARLSARRLVRLLEGPCFRYASRENLRELAVLEKQVAQFPVLGECFSPLDRNDSGISGLR